MIRLLWIPMTGTVAALIVILLTHHPRGEEPAPDFPEPPPALPSDAPEEPVPDSSRPEREQAREPEPAPAEHFLRLEKDGSLVDRDSGRTFADGAAVIAELAKGERVRDRIILSNGDGVEEAALDKLVESLSAKFEEVRKVYRAPEEEK
jgi:hypothetical protein